MNIREDIKAYLDGELSPERMEQVRAALEADPSLQAEAQAFQGITTQIQGAVTMPPVAGLEKALRASPKPQPWYLAPWAIAAPVGACVLAAVAMSINSVGGLREAETTAMSLNSKESVTASPSTSAPEDADSAKRSAHVAQGTFVEGLDTQYPEAANQPQYNPNWRSPSESSEPEFAGGGYSASDSKARTIDAEERKSKSMDGNERVAFKEPFPLNGAGKLPQSSNQQPGSILQYRDRDVIRNANLTVTVEDAREAKDKLVRDIEDAKGFVEISELHADEEKVISHIKARVPVNAFSGVLAQARAMGELKAENATGEDVTLQIVDADARIKELRIKEEQFRILLAKTSKMSEILQIKERIANVRGDIASMTAQRDTLKNMADMSFLDATFEQPKDGSYVGKKSGDWADNSWSGAVGRFDKVWQFVATALMNLLTLAPFWLPVAGVLWWLRRKALKSS